MWWRPPRAGLADLGITPTSVEAVIPPICGVSAPRANMRRPGSREDWPEQDVARRTEPVSTRDNQAKTRARSEIAGKRQTCGDAIPAEWLEAVLRHDHQESAGSRNRPP